MSDGSEKEGERKHNRQILDEIQVIENTKLPYLESTQILAYIRKHSPPAKNLTPPSCARPSSE